MDIDDFINVFKKSYNIPTYVMQRIIETAKIVYFDFDVYVDEFNELASSYKKDPQKTFIEILVKNSADPTHWNIIISKHINYYSSTEPCCNRYPDCRCELKKRDDRKNEYYNTKDYYDTNKYYDSHKYYGSDDNRHSRRIDYGYFFPYGCSNKYDKHLKNKKKACNDIQIILLIIVLILFVYVIIYMYNFIDKGGYLLLNYTK